MSSLVLFFLVTVHRSHSETKLSQHSIQHQIFNVVRGVISRIFMECVIVIVVAFEKRANFVTRVQHSASCFALSGRLSCAEDGPVEQEFIAVAVTIVVSCSGVHEFKRQPTAHGVFAVRKELCHPVWGAHLVDHEMIGRHFPDHAFLGHMARLDETIPDPGWSACTSCPFDTWSFPQQVRHTSCRVQQTGVDDGWHSRASGRFLRVGSLLSPALILMWFAGCMSKFVRHSQLLCRKSCLFIWRCWQFTTRSHVPMCHS